MLAPGAGPSPEPGARSSAEHVSIWEGQHHAAEPAVLAQGLPRPGSLLVVLTLCSCSPAHSGCEEPEKHGESGREAEKGALMRQSQ